MRWLLCAPICLPPSERSVALDEVVVQPWSTSAITKRISGVTSQYGLTMMTSTPTGPNGVKLRRGGHEPDAPRSVPDSPPNPVPPDRPDPHRPERHSHPSSPPLPRQPRP